MLCRSVSAVQLYVLSEGDEASGESPPGVEVLAMKFGAILPPKLRHLYI